MTLSDFLGLFAQFLLLSLLSIGGYATVLPDAHRALVSERAWLDEAGFSQAVALGQVVPGPNFLVFGMLGWSAAGWPGVIACLGGILLPSSLLVARVSPWVRTHREHPLLRAFQVGSAPLVLGLVLASAWLLAKPSLDGVAAALLLLVVAIGAALRPRWPPLGWLALGAVAGAAGMV